MHRWQVPVTGACNRCSHIWECWNVSNICLPLVNRHNRYIDKLQAQCIRLTLVDKAWDSTLCWAMKSSAELLMLGWLLLQPFLARPEKIKLTFSDNKCSYSTSFPNLTLPVHHYCQLTNFLLSLVILWLHLIHRHIIYMNKKQELTWNKKKL